MRLSDLNASWIGGYHNDRATGGTEGWRTVPTRDEAQGLQFQCPKCAVGKEPGEEPDELIPGRVRRFVRGAHHVVCWFRNPRNAQPVGPDVDPKPGRWWVEGETFDDLSFVPGSPPTACSVLLTAGCRWHGLLTRGELSII